MEEQKEEIKMVVATETPEQVVSGLTQELKAELAEKLLKLKNQLDSAEKRLSMNQETPDVDVSTLMEQASKVLEFLQRINHEVRENARLNLGSASGEEIYQDSLEIIMEINSAYRELVKKLKQVS